MQTSEKPRKGTWILVLDILVLLFTVLSVKARVQTRIEYKHIKENCTLAEGTISFAGDVTSGIKLEHTKHNYHLSYGTNQSIVVTFKVNGTEYIRAFDNLAVNTGNRYFQGNQINVYSNNSNRTIAYLESELTPPSILGIIGIILLGAGLMTCLTFIFLTVRWGYDKIHGESAKLAKKEKKEQKAKAAETAEAEAQPITPEEITPDDPADAPPQPEE